MRDLEAIVARMNDARRKGSKSMWYAVAMDTLLDIFLQQETVSREELKDELARRMEASAGNALLRNSYDEAIAQLTDPIAPPAA